VSKHSLICTPDIHADISHFNEDISVTCQTEVKVNVDLYGTRSQGISQLTKCCKTTKYLVSYYAAALISVQLKLC